MVYIIFVMFIASYYLILYKTENTYNIQYTHFEKFVDSNDINKTYNIEPYFNFTFHLIGIKENHYSYADSKIILVNGKNNQTIPMNTTLHLKFSDIKLAVLINSRSSILLLFTK